MNLGSRSLVSYGTTLPVYTQVQRLLYGNGSDADDDMSDDLDMAHHDRTISFSQQDLLNVKQNGEYCSASPETMRAMDELMSVIGPASKHQTIL